MCLLEEMFGAGRGAGGRCPITNPTPPLDYDFSLALSLFHNSLHSHLLVETPQLTCHSRFFGQVGAETPSCSKGRRIRFRILTKDPLFRSGSSDRRRVERTVQE